jgi:hypothetical protein
MSLNTVAQCDTRLLQMELDWKLNRSGPFPDRIRNAIANLRAALAIREAEASHKTPAPAYAATPATTSTTTTTTTDSNAVASTETTTVAMAATVKLHKTTRDDSEEHEGSEERRRDEIGEGNNGLHETREGEDYGVREPDNGITHPAPSPTANAAAKPVPREHTRFDWATETDRSIGPVPSMSAFCPTKPPSPLASPKPAPR